MCIETKKALREAIQGVNQKQESIRQNKTENIGNISKNIRRNYKGEKKHQGKRRHKLTVLLQQILPETVTHRTCYNVTDNKW